MFVNTCLCKMYVKFSPERGLSFHQILKRWDITRWRDGSVTSKVLRTRFKSYFCLQCVFLLWISHQFILHMFLLGISEYSETLQHLRYERRAVTSAGPMSGPCSICPKAGLTVSYWTSYGEKQWIFTLKIIQHKQLPLVKY